MPPYIGWPSYNKWPSCHQLRRQDSVPSPCRPTPWRGHSIAIPCRRDHCGGGQRYGGGYPLLIVQADDDDCGDTEALTGQAENHLVTCPSEYVGFLPQAEICRPGQTCTKEVTQLCRHTLICRPMYAGPAMPARVCRPTYVGQPYDGQPLDIF